jgi:lipoprotein-anchoring transpeptidase ErfK/SrfK
MSNMKQNLGMRTWTLAVLLAAMVAGDCAVAQTNQAQNDQQVSLTSRVQGTTTNNRLIVVSIPDRKLVLMENGAVKRIYPVAVGKPSTPSPGGQFTIVRRVSDPTYSHHGKIVAPGPTNPVGSRWMGLSTKGYGIHGTNEPNSIGKAASHGCIRMARADLEELYALVEVGDAVEIHADHDATVALALGEVAPTPSAPPATVTAVNLVLLADATGSVAPRAGQ